MPTSAKTCTRTPANLIHSCLASIVREEWNFNLPSPDTPKIGRVDFSIYQSKSRTTKTVRATLRTPTPRGRPFAGHLYTFPQPKSFFTFHADHIIHDDDTNVIDEKGKKGVRCPFFLRCCFDGATLDRNDISRRRTVPNKSIPRLQPRPNTNVDPDPHVFLSISVQCYPHSC
jgi:hypothetical protein